MKISEAIQQMEDLMRRIGDVEVVVNKYASEGPMIGIEESSYVNDEMETVVYAILS